MEQQGYKHFSHSHNLIMHQLPEGVPVSCSLCNSSASNTVFVCWQCNFFLHEQCYQAMRSLKHPSHPPHPLTLVPYPTYPSNSFYCNSCEIIGTGLSYSCAHCEFDLHIQCAYSFSIPTTSFKKSHQYTTNYYNPDHQNQLVIPPSWNGQNSSTPTSSQNSITSPQFPPLDVSSVSIPTHNLNPISSNRKFNMAQNIDSVSVPAAYPIYQPDNHVESGQNHKGIMHFSHPHSLCMVNSQDKENEVDCSGCKETLDGKGYSCVEPNCNFHLHESCFHLKQQIQHKSHPDHPLNLLPLAPYNNENGGFNCNACLSDGTGFTYHCSICKFDLHIQCVSLLETVKRSDHEHMLKLYYSCPVKGEEYIFSCDVCHVAIQKDHWGYYCESCDYGTHLGCVDCEERVVDSVFDTHQRLQLQMEMVRLNAQMMTTMNTSLSGHVWFADSGGI